MGPKSDKDWEAESDARTLRDAEVIKKDPTRLKKALKAADKMVKDATAEKEAMDKIAKMKVGDARKKK